MIPFPLLFSEPEPEPARPSDSFDIMKRVAQISGRAVPTGKRDKMLVLHSVTGRDARTDELVIELARQGAPVYYFHTEEFLQACRMSIRLGADNLPLGLLELPTGDLALDEVRSVWFPGPSIALDAVAGLDRDSNDFALRETEAALYGLLGVLNHAFWVNRPDAVQAAEDKLTQLRLASDLGLTIPRTLVTNNPDRARGFFNECDGQVIIKTFRRLAGRVEGRERLILTNRVQNKDVSQFDLVQYCPCLFQEYVPKDVELRITIIGRRVFAVEIHSQDSPISHDDYRRYDLAHTPYYACMLPPAVEQACLRLMDHYGLAFGAIDMIRRPDGVYVFIELNINAQFLWIQDLTGLPLIQTLAGLLIQG